MKKTMLIIVLSVFALGCKPKQTVANTKLDNKTERLMKGDWLVSSVKYVGSDVFKVTSFNIADAKCFEESMWTLVSNNNTGEVVLIRLIVRLSKVKLLGMLIKMEILL